MIIIDGYWICNGDRKFHSLKTEITNRKELEAIRRELAKEHNVTERIEHNINFKIKEK